MSRRTSAVALLLLAAAAALVLVLVVASPAPRGHPGSAARGAVLTVSPAAGGRHVKFVVAVTGHQATGVLGSTRRSYIVQARAVRPAAACVNNRESVLSGQQAGVQMRGTLDPARGEGGPLGWCRGTFDGTVTYSEAYACPPTGTCHPPKGFPTRTRLIARFSFRVE